jgi:ribosomal protein S27AE
MPWSKPSDAPANIQKLNGVSLTLEQMNWIANVADGVKGKYAWAIAISKFKKSFIVDGDSWKKRDKEEKEFSDLLIEKQQNGRYKIVSVSTAAIEDREGETFTVNAIDYEIKRAKETGEYPEFRVFHTKPLGIGRVKSMRRVGIFAVDEGESYDDPFSLAVCEKMLRQNDGRWKTSRGFFVLEASGGCPKCGESLLIREKHMVAGFRCPKCGNTNLGFKGSLNDTRFLKTKTFDITVTDVPAVPWTGVSAFLSNNQEVVMASMTKKELKKRLIKAGLSEEDIEARLSTISEETLKSFDGIPDAEILKEFTDDESDESDEIDDDPEEDNDTPPVHKEKKPVAKEPTDEQVFTLDPAVLKEFARIANKEATEVLSELLEGATLETETDPDEVTKEVEAITELKEEIMALKDVVEKLLKGDETRLKELYSEAPRGSQLRISGFKSTKECAPKKKPVDTEEELDGEEEEDTLPTKKKVTKETNGTIVGADGTVSNSMTDFIRPVTERK